MGSFSMGLAQFIAQENQKEENKEQDKKVYDSLSNDDFESRMQKYIDSKIDKVVKKPKVVDEHTITIPTPKVIIPNIGELKNYFDSLTMVEKSSYLKFYQKIKDYLLDEQKVEFDKIVDGYDEYNDTMVANNTDETTESMESALKEKGYNVKVSRHKIKYVTPCIRVDFDFNLKREFNSEPVKEVMGEYGYKFQSRRRNSMYFVEG
jgi:hypothetical protein